MKRSIIFIVIILLSFTGKSQLFFDLGLKTGFTFSSLNPNQDWESVKNATKLHIGAFSRLGSGRIFFQPEAYFNSRGGDLKKVSSDPALNLNANFDFSSVDVPLLAGIKVVNLPSFNARIMGGPVFGFITAKEVEGSQSVTEDYFKSHFYGWQFGAGTDIFSFLTLDLRYESTRNSVYQSSNVSARNNLFLVSLGIKLISIGERASVKSPFHRQTY